MKNRLYLGLLSAALLLVTAGGVAAQEFRATVRGRVVDSSNAALPGATVNVVNQQTNESRRRRPTRKAATRSRPPAGYVHPDNRNERVPEVHPLGHDAPGQPDRRDQRHHGGGWCHGNSYGVVRAPILETSRADRGTVIDSARIAELPLQSRSPMALVVLVAGVSYNAQAIYLRPFDNGALANWSMNGGQTSNNEFLLDGAPNNANQGGNNIAYVPPAAAVQEMKISTNSDDAQYRPVLPAASSTCR